MKKIIRMMVMAVIVVYVCSSFCMVTAAPQDADVQALVNLARDGDMLSNMLMENARRTLNGEDEEYHEWAVRKGYVVPSETEKIYMDYEYIFMGEPPTMANDWYLTYAKAFDTIEKWVTELERYFIEGYGERAAEVTRDYSCLLEYEGRTMGQTHGIGREYTPHWDTASVQYQDEKKVVMTVEAEDNYLGDITLFTVEFANTKAGWRVSGGSYFEENYGFKSLPAQTGDASVVSIIAVSISVLALGAVVYRRKRTV